jgi:hypothetical protein
MSIEVIYLARENGVTIVTFPPHYIHKLQPLDVGVYKVFKTYYNAAVDSWMMQHPKQTLSIYDIGGIVKVAHQRRLCPQNVISGFRKSGIFAFDRHILTDANFLGSYITGYPNVEETISGTINLTNTLTFICVEGPDFDSADLNVTTLPNLEEEITLKESVSAARGSSVSHTTEQSLAHSSAYNIPEHFRGYPKAGERKR